MNARLARWPVAIVLAALCLGVGLRAAPVGAAPAQAVIPSPAPAYCGQQATDLKFAIRVYPADPAPGQDYLRSGAHGHGGYLRCITFYVGDKTGAAYIKTLVIDQANGAGLLIPFNGVDVTYVNCKIPPMRFPPPPFTGINDCAESWGTTESNWVFRTAPDPVGSPMIPAATP